MSVSVPVTRFVDGQLGKLFVLLRKPQGRATGRSVLVVAPFAEEMNKSRRMLMLVAQALAKRGMATVLPDLYGTGDSEGDHREADWQVWQDDLARAARWAATEGWPVAGLLCVRLGCALGAEASLGLPAAIERTVFWQPVVDGERFLNQFLRLRVMASMMEDRKDTIAALRAQLQSGETIEVAGYELSPRLVAQIDGVRLVPNLGTSLGRLSWMEVVRGADSPLPASSLAAIHSAPATMGAIAPMAVAGEPFWTSTEIVTVPELVDQTARLLANAA